MQSGVLDAGTYTLTEITAPNGYIKSTSPISIKVVYNEATYVNIPNTKAGNITYCLKDPNTNGTALDTIIGITTVGRAGETNDAWPMLRKGGWIALESNANPFVITRMTTAQINAITSPQEGMMTYDTDVKCLKIYNGTQWSCFSTPACPKN